MQIALARLPKPLLLVLLALPEVLALQGNSWCGTLMCVQAIVNTSTVTYQLKSLNQLGWMAIGFGNQMADTPMVIVWQIANGTTVLSQRQASGLVEPLPVAHPPRVATLSPRASSSSGVTRTLAFEISKNNDTLQSLIWAFGVTIPDANSAAQLEQHLDAGTLTLNLTRELDLSGSSPISSVSTSSASAPTTAPTPSASSQPSSSDAAGSSPERIDSLLVAHAALSAAGFLILLPLGTLVARYSRVFTAKWFNAHWFVNVVLGIPLICVGWALGPLAVAQQGREHILTAHLICGVVLVVLYIFEIALGTLIHLRRPKNGASHPSRNVIHVVLGLAVFGLSIYETANGVNRDGSVTAASQRIVIAVCIGWAVVFTGTYSIGLLYLRRQFAQERLGWNVPSSVPLPLPAIAPFVGARVSSESDGVRRRARLAAVDSPMADDGTHDVFSEPWASGVGSPDGEAQDGEVPATEMRQLQAAPVSLTAFW